MISPTQYFIHHYVVLSIDHMIILDGWKLIVAENVQAVGCYYGDHSSDDQQ